MFLAGLSTPVLIFLFVAASAIIWIAGLRIATATDAIAAHFKLGEAFGGMVLLAIVTNLPEIAITTVAAWHNNLDMAVSNILGGIAIQTVVLVLIDVFGVGRSAPLTYKGSSNTLLLEGMALIFILTLVLIGKQFSPDVIFLRTTPFEWMIAGIWLGSIYLISKQSRHPMPHPRKRAYAHALHAGTDKKETTAISTVPISASLTWFAVGAVATLIAGWTLEESGSLLADRFNLGGVLFGATILALSTSLPEISTGIASARIKDYQMAISDIFGGNAFLPVLCLVASLISNSPVLPMLKPTDMYLTGIGILLTGVYMIGMLLPGKKQVARMGIDSLIVLIIYIASIAGIFFLKQA
jgi:cation:H+ antiporter